MASLQEQLAALDEAIASGARTVSYDGRSVTYRELDEMMTARSRLARQVSGGTQVSTSYAEFSRD
ncbi:hypothetical protein [Amorphus sp. 3PC139-8]|uniref:phage head-tail joining protein n=1 Tax=Amorphus sp. 3PC139-8 TaxID=2735676 RepID=UPI00345CA240